MGEILLALLSKVWPYILCGGASCKVQQLRIDSLKIEHEQYVVKIQKESAAALATQVQQNQDWSAKYEAQQKQLDADVVSGAIYERCIAAGRCKRVRVVADAGGAAPGVSASCGVNATVASSVPAQSGPAASDSEGTIASSVPAQSGPAASDSEGTIVIADSQVTNECAATVLQLNRLQDRIEAQPGY